MLLSLSHTFYHRVGNLSAHLQQSKMKKIILLVSLLSILEIQAQLSIESGTRQIGGNLFASMFSSRTSDDEILDIRSNFNLNISWFFKRNISLGFKNSTYYRYYEKKHRGNGYPSEISFDTGLGPVFRYYTRIGLFGETSFTLFYSPDNRKVENSPLEFGLGYCKFVNEHIAIEPILRYSIGQGMYYVQGQKLTILQFGLGLSAYFKKQKVTEPKS